MTEFEQQGHMLHAYVIALTLQWVWHPLCEHAAEKAMAMHIAELAAANLPPYVFNSPERRPFSLLLTRYWFIADTLQWRRKPLYVRTSSF